MVREIHILLLIAVLFLRMSQDHLPVVLRIEFIGGLLYFTCEACQWTQILHLRKQCLSCGREFDQVRLVLGENEILSTVEG